MEQALSDKITCFKNKVEVWREKYQSLTFVYNEQLDCIDINKVKYILVADNPGKQENRSSRYLVGESGIAARAFFKAELGISNFDEEVIVLNKTPIYTNKTENLLSMYDDSEDILRETQVYMSTLLFDIYMICRCKVFIIGFSGCRKSAGNWVVKNHANKRSLPYFFKSLKELSIKNNEEELNDFYLFKHFSMMQFFRDIAKEVSFEEFGNIEKNVLEIGRKYRDEYLSSIKTSSARNTVFKAANKEEVPNP